MAEAAAKVVQPPLCHAAALDFLYSLPEEADDPWGSPLIMDADPVGDMASGEAVPGTVRVLRKLTDSVQASLDLRGLSGLEDILFHC